MSKIELLSPAKNCDVGIDAVNFGADAVYIGAPKFGARAAAGSTLSEIEKLVKYAHRYYAKVYAAVNTILYDSELEEAEKIIWQMYDAGVDAVIIQDMGICEMNLPAIPLFASTQCHNATVEKVKFLEDAGFSRIILARELSFSEIESISKQTTIDLECFIHGSLCVSYSGRCYMSYAVGGRSGNRGACAQPCRKKYTLFDGEGKPVAEGHLLSLKDMNLSAYISRMIDCGVSSFKIEGRLKDSLYVKNVTAYYRKEIDRILETRAISKSSSGSMIFDFEPDTKKTFNRGFCSYFVEGRKNKIGEWRSPKFIGETVGSIRKIISENRVEVETDLEMHAGDGVTFVTDNGELKGSYVSGVDGNIIKLDNSSGLRAQSILYRNYDISFIRMLEKSRTKRVVNITVKCSADKNGILLTAIDEDGVVCDLEYPCDKEKARDINKMSESLRSQLSKSGESIFAIHSVEIDGTIDFFMPVSKMNEARRMLLEKLEKERIQHYHRIERKFLKSSVPYPETEITFESNVLNNKAREFYLRHGVKDIEPAAESGIDISQKRIMRTKYCIKYELGLCQGRGKSHTSEVYFLRDDHGNRFSVKINCENCEMMLYL